MTYHEIFDALEMTGLPVAFNYWESPEQVPALPYIVFTYPDNNDYVADNINYAEIVALEINLYTKRKSPAVERAVEAIITQYFGPYFKTSTYVQGDAVQETSYTMEVIING